MLDRDDDGSAHGDATVQTRARRTNNLRGPPSISSSPSAVSGRPLDPKGRGGGGARGDPIISPAADRDAEAAAPPKHVLTV